MPRSLNDRDVYDLLHEAWLLFQGKTMDTRAGRDALAMAIRNIETLQKVLLMMTEKEPTDSPDGHGR